jgi:hypothetical protein
VLAKLILVSYNLERERERASAFTPRCGASSCFEYCQESSMYRTQNNNATSLLKNVFVPADEEMERHLRGVSSGQPQLFAEIAWSHDLRVIPEHTDHIH